MTELEKGWYVVPTNDRREHYWDGEKFVGNNRRRPETPFAPREARGQSTAGPETQRAVGDSWLINFDGPKSGWSAAAAWMTVIGVLAVIGAAVGGILLLVAKTQVCTANPFNSVYGTDLQDCTDRHPFVGAGLGVLVGGLLQAAVIFVVAALCKNLAGARAAAVPMVQQGVNDLGDDGDPAPPFPGSPFHA